MRQTFRANNTFIWVVLSVGILIGVLTPLFVRWRKQRESAVVMDLVRTLKHMRSDEMHHNGYWVGDVAGLYALNLISRDVAEADFAPITPLVNRPQPYHDYFVVAMESGPGTMPPHNPVPLKGQTRNKDVYAFCVYPAEDEHPDLPVYIVCPWGMYSRVSKGSKPVLNWPTKSEMGRGWGIID